MNITVNQYLPLRINLLIPHECILTLYLVFAAVSEDNEGSADGGEQEHFMKCFSISWALFSWRYPKLLTGEL